MAYDSSTKIITAPVGIADLQQCFNVVLKKTIDGVTQRVVSGDLGLNTKAEIGDTINGWTVESRVVINKWSKHKPIRHTKITQLSEESGNNNWTDNNQGNDARYGIFKSADVYPFDFKNGTGASGVSCPSAVWLYDKPAVSDQIQLPARITDFDKYYHYAPCPIRISWPQKNNQDKIEIIVSDRTDDNKNNILCFTLEFEEAISQYRTDGTCFSLQDILGHQNWYICVAFAKKLSNNPYELRFFNTDITKVNRGQSEPKRVQDIQGGNNPVVNIFVSVYEFMQLCPSPLLYAADEEWMCRVFLTSSTLQSDTRCWEMEYESGVDSSVCICKSVQQIQNIGIVTLTTTIRKSGSNYYLDMFSATIEKGTLGTNSIQYQIIGVCPTGVMKKNNTSYSELVLVDTSSATFVNDKIEITNRVVGQQYGVFDFTDTPSSYPKMAIVRLKVTVNNKDKEVFTSTDCSIGEPPFVVTQSG